MSGSYLFVSPAESACSLSRTVLPKRPLTVLVFSPTSAILSIARSPSSVVATSSSVVTRMILHRRMIVLVIFDVFVDAPPCLGRIVLHGPKQLALVVSLHVVVGRDLPSRSFPVRLLEDFSGGNDSGALPNLFVPQSLHHGRLDPKNTLPVRPGVLARPVRRDILLSPIGDGSITLF